jgi:pimeloyl-ACP methyl ester carboxylesterase
MSEIALFVHSTGTGPFMWTRLLGELPQGIQVLTPVNRGYAPSDLLPRGTPFALAQEVAHLKAQIPAGTTGVHLAGHSYGGLVALALATEAGVPVRSLWLYEPVLFGSLKAEKASLPDDAVRDVDWLFDAPDFLHDTQVGGGEDWLRTFIDYWNQPGMWAAMPDKAKDMARLVGWKMYQEVRCVALEPQPFAHYRLDVPMTLVQGEHTTPPAREMVKRLAQVNPQAHVEVLTGLGHMGLVAAPQQVQPSLQRHWARVQAALDQAA